MFFVFAAANSAAAQVSLTASPVEVPAGSGFGVTNIGWEAKNNESATLYLVDDKGKLVWMGKGTSGSFTAAFIAPGAAYEFYLYPTEERTVPLATLSVVGTQSVSYYPDFQDVRERFLRFWKLPLLVIFLLLTGAHLLARFNRHAAARQILVGAALTLAIGCAAAIILRTPNMPFAEQPAPDAQEAMDTAHQIYAGNGFVTSLYGDALLPSRYPPSFSLMLTPFLSAGEYPANVMNAAKFFALFYLGLAVFAAWWMGGKPAALLAAIFVGVSPFAAHYSGIVLSEAFTAGLIILIAVLIHKPSWRRVIIAGALAGFLITVRLQLAVCLPALLLALPTVRRKIWATAAASVFLLANGIYNWKVFGSFFATGYSYWFPTLRAFAAEFAFRVPSQSDGPWIVPDLLRGWLMVWVCPCEKGGSITAFPNIIFYPLLLAGAFWIFAPPLITLYGLAKAWMRRSEPVARFALWFSGFSILLFSFYFYQAARFMAAASSLLLVFAAVGFGSKLRSFVENDWTKDYQEGFPPDGKLSLTRRLINSSGTLSALSLFTSRHLSSAPSVASFLNSFAAKLKMHLPVLLLIFIYIILSVIKLRYPGFQYDEVLFGNAASGVLDDSFIHKKIFGFPVMVMPYIGALKAYFYYPILLIFGSSYLSVRLPMILLTAASLWMIYKYVTKAVGTSTAILSVLFLAADASLISLVRTDVGPVAVGLFFRCLTLLYFFKFIEHRRGKYLIVMCGAMLLGFFDKLNFVWFIIAFVPASVLYETVFGTISGLLKSKTAKILTGTFIVIFIGLVLLIFNLGIGKELSLIPNYDRFSSLYKLIISSANGSAFYEYLISDWTNFPILGWTIWLIIFGGSLTTMFQPKSAAKTFHLFNLVMLLLIILQILLTDRATAPWHSFMLQPITAILAASSLLSLSGAIFRKNLSYQKILATVTALIIFGGQIFVYSTYISAYDKPYRNHLWSKKIDELYAFSESVPNKFIEIDWGFHNQLLLLGRRANKYQELAATFNEPLSPVQMEWMKNDIMNPDNNYLYVFHDEADTQMKPARKRFFETAQQLGLNAELVKTFDESGKPLYEVYRLKRE